MRKRMLSLILAVAILLSIAPIGIANVSALSPKYTVSSSYKASSYYSSLCGVTLTGNQREDIVNVALSQVGYREGSYSNDYGGADDGSYNNYTEYNYWYHNYVSSGMPVGGDGAPWCATFVSWCAEQANVPSTILKRSTAAGHGASYFNINFYSGSSTLASSADNDSYFKGYNYIPKPGDLFFTRSWSHVGLVVAVNGAYVTTVEGNTNTNGSSQGNGVYRLTWRKITDLYFGVPNYQTGSIPQKPTIITNTPSYISGTNITISWKAVSGNSFYWINVFKDGNIIVDQSMGTSTSYTLSNAAVGEYLVYVSANNSAGTSGSSSYTFSVIEKPTRTIDNRYASFLPIGAYTLSTGRISVYDETGTLYSNRYIDGATDLCAILEIYTDGWCKVRYPSSAESSGYFNAYVPLSTFTACTSPSSWTATGDYTTYKRSDLGSVMYSVSSGTSCLLLNTTGSRKQIIHRVSGQSACLMGWIDDPKQIHVSTSSVSLMLGGTESTVIYAWSTGSYDGNTALYYSRSNDSIGCSWGDWENGKAPLTISALNKGTTKLTIGVKDYDTGAILDSTTVSVTVDAKSYTVSYNANGGSGAPSSQTKYHNTTLTLSSTKPVRTGYTFLGWSTNSSATSASYKPGGSFTANANTTLYAVWQKGCENNTHSYSYKVSKTPTVSATGTLTGTCSKCSSTTSVTLPKLNTTDYSYSVTKAATCTAAGIGRYTWKTTIYGNFYFDVSIAATGHSYNYNTTKTPTTSATGTLTGTCSKCNGTTTVTLPKLNTTDYSYAVTKAATCTTVGTGRYTWKTTTYGNFYFDVSIAATGHSYSYKVTKTPTISTAGTLTGTCSRCSGTTAVTLPKLNNTDYSYSVTKAVTCTAAGTGRYTWKTTTYGNFYFDVSIAALGHTWDNGVVTREPTEDTPGERRYTCTACGATKIESIPVIGHQHKYVSYVIAPTCTEQGYRMYFCECGDGYAADYIDALGHNFGDWVVIRKPTATEDGIEARVCTRCNHAEQRTIAKLESPFTDVAPGSFYYDPVMWAIENGITNGISNTKFGPAQSCNRAQVVTFLWAAAGKPEPQSTVNPFEDVPKGSFFEKPVLWAVEQGITSGTDVTHFSPGAACNRATVVTFLWNAAGRPAVTGTNSFTDVPAGAWYAVPVLWAAKEGITSGISPTEFGAAAICNRAQVVTFLYKAFED